MFNFNRKKRRMTLLEVLVAIVLIGVISTAVLTNVKNGLAKGKEAKNKYRLQQVQQILMFECLESIEDPQEIAKKWKTIIQASSVFKGEPKEKRCLDLYGKEWNVSVVEGHLEVSAK